MSYPFTRAFSWGEFIEQMEKLNVALKKEDLPWRDDETVEVTYFENKMHGETYTCVVDIADYGQMLLPGTIRGICKSLNIHPKVFGLNLG